MRDESKNNASESQAEPAVTGAADMERRVKIRLIELNMSMEDLANELGVTRQAVYQMIATGNPRVSSINKLAAALGVEPHWLLKPLGTDEERGEHERIA